MNVIQAFHIVRIVLHILDVAHGTRTSIAYKLIIFRPSTTDTMPLTTKISRAATKWFATSQKININMQHIHFIIRIATKP